MITFRIAPKLTDRERYKLSLYVIFQTRPVRRSLGIAFFPFILIILISILFGLDSGNFLNSLLTLIFPVILVLLLVLSPWIIIKRKKNRHPVYEFDENGVMIIVDDKSTAISWEYISGYKELENYILIEIGSSQLNKHVIPKIEFVNPEELQNFIGFLEQHGVKRQ